MNSQGVNVIKQYSFALLQFTLSAESSTLLHHIVIGLYPQWGEIRLMY